MKSIDKRRGVMLPVTEQLSDYYSEQANEISPCSELNPFLNMLRARIFPIQKMIFLHFVLSTENFFVLLESKVHRLS